MILSLTIGVTLSMFCLGISIFFLSEESLFLMWMSLELITWSLLPLMLLKKKILMVEGMMKYFILQSLSSLIWVISSLIWQEMSYLNWQGAEFFLTTLMFSSLMLKLGIFPLHGWVMDLLCVSDIAIIFFLLVLQKIPPLIVMMKMLFLSQMSFFLKMFLIFPIFFFCYFSLPNFSKIYFLLFFSSLYHMSIMFLMMSWEGSSNITILYFFSYSVYFGICSWSCYITHYENKSQNTSMSLFLIFWGMSGMPPFLMFLVKVLFVNTLNWAWSDLILMFFAVIMTLYIFSFLSFFLENLSKTSSSSYTISNMYFPSLSLNILSYMGIFFMPAFLICL
uniref:NADH-ubiquinone oxidoreductase chain 2 n=1 Tax=Baltalimania ylvae TaxID=3341436 RepID=A0A1X9WD93_9BILA|nr:NADH dehydrogenase subunit 2 [Archaphanostoma ylvae]ARS00898.1 NADH dehydrogenase subunit 2 [Archaphanostoma ylvae]